MSKRTFKVSEVAALSGVTVRALHHYDKIGLLQPSGRTASQHRLYSTDDLIRLQQILASRELGLSLEKIRVMLEDPALDRRALLLEQRHALLEREAEARRMVEAIDRALGALDDVGSVDWKALFDGFDPREHEAEVADRWGQTDAYHESNRRTKGYKKADWERLRREQDDLMSRIAAAIRSGVSSTSDEACDLADEHRRSIDQWFYPCSREHHAQLAAMYEQDERFAATFEKHCEGMTAFLVDAIRANQARHADES